MRGEFGKSARSKCACFSAGEVRRREYPCPATAEEVPPGTVMANQREIGICLYCGEVKELGDPDHVIPRCLFEHGNQAKLTVPCCRSCNTKKSAGETELSAYLLARKESGDHPAAQHLWPEVQKAVEKNVSKVARAGAAASWQANFSKNGVYLGHELIADLGTAIKPIVASLRYMVHGLHVIQTGQLLPPGTPIEALLIPPEQYRSTLRRLGPLMNCGVYGMGPGTITWAGHVRKDPPHTGIWLLEFFESVLVVGVVGVARPTERNPQRYSRLLSRKEQRRLDTLIEGRLLLPKPKNFLDVLAKNEPE